MTALHRYQSMKIMMNTSTLVVTQWEIGRRLFINLVVTRRKAGRRHAQTNKQTNKQTTSVNKKGVLSNAILNKSTSN
jgi:hypothetical protein